MIDLGGRLGAEGKVGRTALDHYRALLVGAFTVHWLAVARASGDPVTVLCNTCGAEFKVPTAKGLQQMGARLAAERGMQHREGCLVPLQLAAERAALKVESDGRA